jgi:HAD superfamily hydrolase (TIGR01450 family)
MRSLLEAFDGFLLDLDGVVYVGEQALPGAAEAISVLRAAGKELLFLTNDPRRSRSEYAGRLNRLGIQAAAGDVLTAGAATAAYLRDHERLQGASAFVIGTSALKEELRQAGLRIMETDQAHGVDVVVVGGHEAFDYEELRLAAQAVLAGARLFATGRDATFPMPDGPWPAAGAIVAAVEVASGRRAIAIGKPEPHMFAAARSRLHSSKLAVIGDSVASDIVGGRRAGCATILIGPGKPADYPPGAGRPDVVLPSLLDVVRTHQP